MTPYVGCVLGLGVYGYMYPGRVCNSRAGAPLPGSRVQSRFTLNLSFHFSIKVVLWFLSFFWSCLCRLGSTDMPPFCACMKSTGRISQINGVHWNETVIFCGDFNWFVDFVQTNLLYLMPSQRASWLVDYIKMQSSYFLILYSGIPKSEFLPGSVHPRASTWVFFPSQVT